MSSSNSRLSKIPFPPYTHLPGKTVHPNKPGGHQFEKQEPLAPPLKPEHALKHELYCYGIDLLNHGFFWESHVAFEAIWHAQERQGEVADLLKALIKVGAAGLKQRLGQEVAAQAHLERAFELIEKLQQKHSIFCALNLAELLELTPQKIQVRPSS